MSGWAGVGSRRTGALFVADDLEPEEARTLYANLAERLRPAARRLSVVKSTL